MKKITAGTFAQMLRETSNNNEQCFAFFLGAGCSVSSGIPAAGQLVKDVWLPRFRDSRAKDRRDIDAWAKELFPDYEPGHPALSYSEVVGEFFDQESLRQAEIETLCKDKYPGLGYAVLAALMAKNGKRFNVAITTNFDDLAQDALYLFTEAKPTVIHHEAMAGFIRPTTGRPLVVKLHGDMRFSQKHTDEELEHLSPKTSHSVTNVLHGRGLIFIGYGGNDQGVVEMLKALPADALHWGVYWVGSKEPQGKIRGWLDSPIVKDKVRFVEQGDFDEFMFHIQMELGIPIPAKDRFDKVFGECKQSYENLYNKLQARPKKTREDEALIAAMEKEAEEHEGWWAVEMRAGSVKKSDPDKANEIYLEGIKQFPDSHELLGNYANFLTAIRKDNDGAETYYKRALETNPKHAHHLGNYANFLTAIRKDNDGAETYYKRALETNPKHALHLGNYAFFLTDIRKDHDGAETHYKRALEADPKHANNLGNYALFLTDIRKDHDGAETHYKRALEADPKHANSLGNYAGLLLGRAKTEEGLAMLEKALAHPEVMQGDNKALAVECRFYAYAHQSPENRKEAVKNLKGLILSGARSPGWNLKPNIEQAKLAKHPHAQWLEKLAAVISDGADVSTLDGWPEWKNA